MLPWMVNNCVRLYFVNRAFFPIIFWEGHRLNLICVWEFPMYLWLSLPSGLRCVMSYLMQPDKHYACTDSIKGNEWGTHMVRLSVYRSSRTDFQILASYSTPSPHSTAWFGLKAIHSIPHLLCSMTKNPLQTSVLTESPIRCVACCLVIETPLLNYQICKVTT